MHSSPSWPNPKQPSFQSMLYGRYAVIPAYLYSAWSLVHSLSSSGQPALLALGGAAAACITLVPAELVEYRCDCGVLQACWLGGGDSLRYECG